MRKFVVRTTKDKDSLRLEWTYEGRRRTLYPGLADNKTNRIKAQQIALQIEADVEIGTYDDSLFKYKKVAKLLPLLTPVELFDSWLQFKKNNWDISTFKIKTCLKSDLENFFSTKNNHLTEEDIKKFYNWLNSKNLAPKTLNRKLDTFQAAWEWLLESGQVSANYWCDLPRHKIGKNIRAKPFTKLEVDKIIQAFESNENLNHYTIFIRFLFGTGCRLGEAIGIRWEDIDLDTGRIIIAEQITSGRRKAAKSGSCREFYLSPGLKGLLSEFKSVVACEDLIFTTQTGKQINTHDFRRDTWKPILELASVVYRKPSNTRHSFCSHALESGMNPLTIAAITGHDPKVLFDHYAGLISKPQAPEIF